jgi:anti-sigma B factor antagonist
MELDIGVRSLDGVTVVDVAGEVDLYTAPRLEEALAKASTAAGSLVVVNLTKTGYLDSTALRVLTSALKRVRDRQGGMAVVSAQPKITKLFTLTGLDQVFTICTTEGEAITSVRTPPAP